MKVCFRWPYDRYWRYLNGYYNFRSGYYNCRKDEVFSTSTGALYNLNRLDEFLKNIENNQPDAIRAITYSIEDEPIIFHMFYNGEDILAVRDTTNSTSGFGKKSIKEFNGDTIHINEKDKSRYYK